MVLQYFAAQVGGFEVGVDLGGAYALMAEHGLNGPQVGTALEQNRGKGVAQGVRLNGLLDARSHGLPLDHDEYHGAREVMAAPVEKHVVFLAGLDGHQIAVHIP